jgi:hypothetical protein
MGKKIASDIAHITIRIREDLRKKLVKAAESEQRSLNSEIAVRLDESFEIKGRIEIEKLAASLNKEIVRLEALHETRQQEMEQFRAMQRDFAERFASRERWREEEK